MRRSILTILILALAQFGCGYQYGDAYRPDDEPRTWSPTVERQKRELLLIEDLKIGKGPIAAWNRRITAELEVRYVDGTLVYRGPAFFLDGFYGLPDAGIYDERALTAAQEGIRLGLNGMAVGGRRRITVDRSLVCTNLPKDASPRAACNLVGPGNHSEGTRVRKEKLIVEAVLKESCVPVLLKVFVLTFRKNWEVYCRTQNVPRVGPADPVWRFY